MPDEEPGSERFRDYFKYISTVDAAGAVGVLALRDRFGFVPEDLGIPLVCFGVSAYLCIIGMFVLARAPHWAEGELIDWLLVLTVSITTLGISSIVSTGVFGG